MVSLFGRKRTSELSESSGNPHQNLATDVKKDELLALKLEEFNSDARQTGTLQMLPINLIYPDPTQPRKIFKSVDSLAASIHEKGVIQPIIVRTKNAEGHYVIIAGERRYRAAIAAELMTIPCIVRSESDASVLILQLLENDQRENVSPLEESEALSRLIDEMNLSKTDIARELGRDVGWISIRLGLKKASEDIKQLVREGIIEDIRTLHELRMFETEQPEKARKLITRIRSNTISGTYRHVISGARSTTKSRDPDEMVRAVTGLERVNDEIVLHVVGKKRPVRYRVSTELLKEFLEKV
jgi:ParB family chromosome partitioning protein